MKTDLRVPAKSAAFLWALALACDTGHTLRMWRHPGGTLGAAITPRALRQLRRAGLVDVGPFEPGAGRTLAITELGRAYAVPPRLAFGRPIDDERGKRDG